MPLFPTFVDIKGKDILIVGGGNVAQRKIEKLVDFNPNLYVVGKKINEQIKELKKSYKNITLYERAFEFSDIEDKDMVIVAVDDVNLQEEIYKECKKRNIPINSVDSPDYCTFIFPALIVRGDLVIGISTSGKVPGLSAKVRKHIEKCLPQEIESLLEQLYQVRESTPKGEGRQRKILQLIEKLFED
ncbi:MAG: bifunctional precorrin-2 dehydrogenase/sirohydrochlorin ferrochelatase [Aquificae bacterium]|nr:bifunctional precorrin-2 dehydrogenase/sirohydrochlorin ferrochelatase [Aquificota bacterium]